MGWGTVCTPDNEGKTAWKIFTDHMTFQLEAVYVLKQYIQGQVLVNKNYRKRERVILRITHTILTSHDWKARWSP